MVAIKQTLACDSPPVTPDRRPSLAATQGVPGGRPSLVVEQRGHLDGIGPHAFESVEPSATVMVLEGDAQVCLNLGEWLCGQGASVRPVVDGSHLLEFSAATGPACFLLDFDACRTNGFETLANLRRRFPSVPTIVLSGQTDVRTVVRAMRLGAFDVLPKPHDWEEIRAAIRWALRPSSADKPLPDDATLIRERAARLTGRERAILRLILRGMLNKQVAHELGLALVTVKVHRGNAMRKLGIRTAAELGRIAEFAGL